MKVIYKGDHAEVVVPVTASMNIAAVWGEPVDMPDELAESLLKSTAWMKASKEATKKAEAPAPADTTNEKGAS